MGPNDRLRRAVLPPIVVTAVGAVGVVIAYILDQTPVQEWALTIGAPSFLIVFIGLIYLAVMLVWYFISQHLARRKQGGGS